MDSHDNLVTETPVDELLVCLLALVAETIAADSEESEAAPTSRKRAPTVSLAELQQRRAVPRLRFDNWESLRRADGELFRRRLRLSPAQFHFVAQLVRQHIPHGSHRPHTMNTDKPLALFVKFRAHIHTMVEIVADLAVGRCPARRTVKRR